MGKDKRIYNRIKMALALRQLKNKDLAEHMNVSAQTVSKWCTNYSQPSIPELFEISKFLKMKIAELLEPEDWD